MSFGRLVRKFGILKRNLECSLKTSSSILMACAALHNYVIEQQLEQRAADKTEKESQMEVDDSDGNSSDDSDDSVRCTQLAGAPLGMQYLPILPDEEFEVVPGMSMTRLAIIEEIRRQNYRRPLHNVIRNQDNRDVNNRYIVPLDSNGNALEVEFFHP
jgi:hypothetical protein